MNKDYLEALASPQWQKKRLEIMQRDNFTCQYCGCKDKTLHIHHKVYKNGKKPWEYDDKYLITLCDKCHEYITNDKNRLYEQFIYVRDNMREYGFSDAILNAILEHIGAFFERRKEKTECYYDDQMIESIIEDAVLSTQNYDDIKMLAKLGGSHFDFIKNQYPMFIDDYSSITAIAKKMGDK